MIRAVVGDGPRAAAEVATSPPLGGVWANGRVVELLPDGSTTCFSGLAARGGEHRIDGGKMPKESKREARRQQRRRQRRRGYLIWGGIGLLVLIGAGWLVARALQPAAGEAAPLMEATHIAEGTDPGAYTTDPPTSGQHYPATYDAKFY